MSKAGMKLTQSLINDTLTITTLTYAATAAINSDANDVAPNGMPNTISVSCKSGLNYHKNYSKHYSQVLIVFFRREAAISNQAAAMLGSVRNGLLNPRKTPNQPCIINL